MPCDRHSRFRTSVFGAAFGFFLLALAVGTMVGPADLSFGAILSELGSHVPGLGISSSLTERQAVILWQWRLPRVVLGALVGASLSMSGAGYQGVFRNPLAAPFLLGVAAGAGLGATVAIVTGIDVGFGPIDTVALCAFVGALVAVTAAAALGRLGGRSTAVLLLGGVAVASFLTAVQTYLLQRHSDTLREVYSWVFGRLSTAGWSEVALLGPYVLVCGGILHLHRRHLDVLRLGEDEARALGLDMRASVRWVVLVAASLLTAAAVAVSGIIAFVGLVVPHAVRLLAGSSYRIVVPLSALLGAGFLVLADVVGPNSGQPGRAPDRGRHVVHRRPVLRPGAVALPSGADMTNPAAPVEASPGVGLSVTGLSVTYGRHVVVRDVTFDVAPGSWLGVIGPNGAGKSTVLRAVAGLVEATGEITFHGSVNPKRAQVVAYLPQTPELPAAMTVAEYVLLGRSAHLGWFESESRKDRSVVAASLARLELTRFAERNLTELSGGEAQRVALARALAQDAPILVLDEPTSALDLGHQGRCSNSSPSFESNGT